MATAQAATIVEPDEGRLVIRDAGWDDYEAMLGIVGERRLRVTYDGSMLEARMPSQRHEQAVQLLGLLITRLAEELGLPYEPLGMTTWRKPGASKGLEPDQCYYFAHHEAARSGGPIDLDVDPPPDLAVEVEITRSALDRMALYAAIGVPEVWRYDGAVLSIHVLQADGTYTVAPTSPTLPGVRPADVERFLELGRSLDKLRWSRELRDWARAELIPRGDAGA